LQKVIKNNLCKVSRQRARDWDETWDLQDRDFKICVWRRVSKTETKSRDSITANYSHFSL